VATSQLSADTRARILEAAWERVRDGGSAAVSVKDIAAEARVSRQLVYFHYGNRAGLLTAMVRHRDETSGFRRRAAATRELPPVEALDAPCGSGAATCPSWWAWLGRSRLRS
jgi:AcrR family transcriptional regulator